MDINKIEALIKIGDLELFKKEFQSSPINSHHKNVLLAKCFNAGHTELIEFMFGRANTNSKTIIPFLLSALEAPIKKENLVFFHQIKDIELIPHVDRIVTANLIKHQNEKTYAWFIDKFPLTTIKNFVSIISHSLTYNKIDYIKPFHTCQMNYKSCYYLCFDAFQADRPDVAHEFLVSQIKFNPNIIQEIKFHQQELFSRYMEEKQQMAIYRAQAAARAAANPPRPVKRRRKVVVMPVVPTVIAPASKSELPQEEKINEFINHQLAQAFSVYLNESLQKKDATKTRTNKI